VVITGAGTVTSLGLGVTQTLDALRSGAIGIGSAEPIGYRDSASKRAGLVAKFTAADVDRRLDFDEMNSISRYAAAASKLALDNAGLRVTQKNCDDIGVVMGVCNGPPEEDHMNSVFKSDNFEPHINCFSNITANSTAGWVSNALCLKGVNMTLSPGPHAGLASVAYAFNALRLRRAKAMLASGSDELYYQMFYNYNLIGLLKQGSAEDPFALDLAEPKRKVIAEGAATLVLETMESASERGALILAEVRSYGMTVDGQEFSKQSMNADGLMAACEVALGRAGIAWRDIGLAIWAPQGNGSDAKVLNVLNANGLGAVPLVATTFNTGYIETASILVGVGCALTALKNGTDLWPQKTGDPALDNRKLTTAPSHILVLASTDLGYNFALVVSPGVGPS
jgi:3-oxoacyl-(acyl-carrier-protein) synthase